MKFFKLLFLASLSAIIIILTGCERRLVSPIDPSDPPQIDTQFAQKALSDLADTANSQGFINLADAANDFAEALATEDQTYVQPTFSKLSRLASEVTYLIDSFDNAGCSVELRPFAEATVEAIKAYTIRDAAEMNHALQELAQEASTANMTLQRLSGLTALNNSFRPFVFGYSSRYWHDGIYELGKMALGYENIDIRNETDTAVIDFLATKGYKAIRRHGYSGGECNYLYVIDLGAQVNTWLIIEEFEEELKNIPNLVFIEPVAYCPFPKPTAEVRLIYVFELNRLIANAISYRYNEAWCQGNLDVNTIDSILIEESKLDFFNYTFLRKLADIFAEEKPETTELIGSNVFSFRSIVLGFLRIYFQNSGKTNGELVEIYSQYGLTPYVAVPENFDENSFRTPEKAIDEIIEIFRQSVRKGSVDITADKAPDSYYYRWNWR
ncbi:MAG: hypothetical protein OXI67_12670 [Candidatus Poribacteria bacterium]|nr:hypothetical protein [Candidatus Poribacteria bacterium]